MTAFCSLHTPYSGAAVVHVDVAVQFFQVTQVKLLPQFRTSLPYRCCNFSLFILKNGNGTPPMIHVIVDNLEEPKQKKTQDQSIEFKVDKDDPTRFKTPDLSIKPDRDNSLESPNDWPKDQPLRIDQRNDQPDAKIKRSTDGSFNPRPTVPHSANSAIITHTLRPGADQAAS